MSLSSDLLRFIYDHRNEDVRTLALSQKLELPTPPKPTDNPPPEGWGAYALPSILSAIQARQKLAYKWSEWAKHPEVYVPEPIMVEQASSPETARYKARFIRNSQWKVLDLSGGLGADSYAFAEVAQSVDYLDASPERSAVAAHNFKALATRNIHCHTGLAEERGLMLASQLQPNLIYIDPDRRPTASKRVFSLEESLPDITTLIPTLRKATPHAELLIKLSPMADIDYLMKSFGEQFDLHVVGVRREARELLLHYHSTATYHCTAIEIQLDRCYYATGTLGVESHLPVSPQVGAYLYDLFPAFSKIGYAALSPNPTIWQPAPHTHLYFSEYYLPHFPGRHFRVLEHNRGEKRWLRQVTQSPIHLLAKNLPTSTDQLRKQLRITEGGDKFLFAYSDLHLRRHFVLAELCNPPTGCFKRVY